MKPSEPNYPERAACWICDHGLLIIGITLILLAAIMFRFHMPTSPVIIIEEPKPAPTGSVATPQPELYPTSTASFIAPTKIEMATPTPASTDLAPTKPQFMIAFVPVNWDDAAGDFESIAHNHADFFIRESHIDEYFDVDTVFLSQSIRDADLSSDTLALDIVEFAAPITPADLFIGLTTDNIVVGGSPDITGWSLGPGTNSVIVEAGQTSVTAHELGHVFGLCDEYSFDYWSEQDKTFAAGCPNPYPADCPKISGDVVCSGQITDDGINSIMGPSGLPGEYGFNQDCLSALAAAFESLSRQK